MKEKRLHQRQALLRKISIFLMDILFVAAAVVCATMLRFFPDVPDEQVALTARWLPAILLCYGVVFLLGRTPSVMWRHASNKDILYLSLLSLVAAAITLALHALLDWSISRPVLAMTGVLSSFFCWGVRVLWPQYRGHMAHAKADGEKRNAPVLIVGAGEGASLVIRMCASASLGKPVAMVDDDPRKQNLRIDGVPVLGTLEDIPALIERHRVREVFIAIMELPKDKLSRVVADCNDAKCQVRIMTYPTEIGKAPEASGRIALRSLNISDFLPRAEVDLSVEQISGYLKGKRVLVTGGGGSIGSELCRQIMRFEPVRLTIFDCYENSAYELQCELWRQYGRDCPVEVLIGTIQDKRRMDEVMAVCQPNVVFHAAAHKHVPLMEASPAEAVKNNVLGTRNVLEAASRHGVECFVSLSTDKAVNPTNVMGATKRITEMLVQLYARQTQMKCMAVRFGNVLGSHGSVIPLFESQIQHGGPVTITDPEIERYFMTIPEAAQLVLQAGGLAESGTIYILDMGQPVKIMDLAEKMIRFYGYTPGRDIEIKITGLRPGEKLYEELMMDDEAREMTHTCHRRIFAAPPIPFQAEDFLAQLEDLARVAERNDSGVVEALAEIVPTYHPNRLKTAG